MPAMIGVVMLMGLVTKNAILLIDYTNRLRREQGLGVKEALLAAGPVRLRPIMMTTVAMVLGMLPSAIGTMPQASATAAPPLEPPQVLDRSQGLRVAPNTRLNVCEPAPNSGVLVLPTVTAPAAFSRSTTSAF